MIPESNVEKLCELIALCECIGELRISECELTSSQLTEIEKALGGKEVSFCISIGLIVQRGKWPTFENYVLLYL